MSKYQIAFEGGSDVRRCRDCGENTFHDAQKVMVYSKAGARSVWLWACEKHPLPDAVTDED